MNKKSFTLRLDAVSKIILLILGAGIWFVALKPIGSSVVNAESNRDSQDGQEKNRAKTKFDTYAPADMKEAYLNELCGYADSIDRKLRSISISLIDLEGLRKLSSIERQVGDIYRYISFPFPRSSGDSDVQSDYPSSFDYLATQRAKASKSQKQKTPTEPSASPSRNED
jgi:hypothetical protein